MTEVEEFLNEHPEFRASMQVRRGENGESVSADRSDWLGDGGSRRYTAYGALGDITDLERGGELRPVWPAAPRDRTSRQMAARVEEALRHLAPKYRDLLDRVYYQRQTQEEVARDLGISQQAVSQRLDTAHAALVKVIADHGQEWEDIDSE